MKMKDITGVYKRTNKYVVDKVYKGSSGGERIQGVFSTKKEALNFIIEKQKEIDARIQDGILHINKKYIFDDLFYLYSKECNWSEYTIKKQFQRYVKYFKDFREVKLLSISIGKIEKWYSDIRLLVLQQKIQHHYACKLYRMMKGCVKIGYECGCFKTKMNLDFIQTNAIPLEQKKNPFCNVDYITHKELITICEEIHHLPNGKGSHIDSNDFCFLLKFLFYTGCRINEARAIKVKDIRHIKDKYGQEDRILYKINIHSQLEDNGIKHIPVKGKRNRFTYIVDEFQKDLDDFIARKEFDEEDYLFDINKCHFPLSRKKIHDAIYVNLKALKKYKLVGENFIDNLSPHGLRYSNTLYFEQLGIPSDISAMNRGHSQIVMHNIYDRIDKDFIDTFFTYEVEA